MRAYLLGLLSADEASALEEEYFVNRAVFLKIQSEETALIADYLGGNLRPKEKQSFEQRYLEVPALRSKVEAARREHASVRQNVRPTFSLAWRLGAAAALVTVVLLGIWIYQARVKSQKSSSTSVQIPVQQSPRPTQQVPVPPTMQPNSSGVHHANRSKSPVQPQQFALLPHQVQPQSQAQPPSQSDLPTQVVAALIYLTPGVTKGSNSNVRAFQQPAADTSLRLVLVLPGQFRPVDRIVQILNVEQDGSWRLIWSSDKLLASSTQFVYTLHGPARIPHQIISLTLPASLFQSGDYIVQTRTADNEIQESYLYRVLPPQSSDQN